MVVNVCSKREFLSVERELKHDDERGKDRRRGSTEEFRSQHLDWDNGESFSTEWLKLIVHNWAIT